MTRYIVKRLGLALITLVLLSMIVFATAQLLPGDVGRNILGPFAPQSAVDAINKQLGADRPVVVQYWDWIVRRRCRATSASRSRSRCRSGRSSAPRSATRSSSRSSRS